MTNVRQGPSELLALLERRWNSEIKDLPDAYEAPFETPKRRDEIETAARLHATADHSNPFAFGRIKLHLKRGLEGIKETRESALSAIGARARNGIRIPAVLK